MNHFASSSSTRFLSLLMFFVCLELQARSDLKFDLTEQQKRKVTELSPGVYEIQHKDDNDGFAGGNTTVIIGERQVFVVDASFLPSEAKEDIAQIRQWTNKPISFLLNTHFHNDHNLGNRVYMDAFPSITIIAHKETKKEMDLFGPGSLSREERGTAAYQKMLDSGKNNEGAALSEEDKSQLKQILCEDGRLKRS